MLTLSTSSAVRVGLYGAELPGGRGVGLWQAGYRDTLTYAGAEPVYLEQATGGETWDEVLDRVHGVVLSGHGSRLGQSLGDEESLCQWCRQRKIPLLAIDQGLLALNSAFGGTNFGDLAKEFPEAIQHRHPPEPGLRHAINVEPGTMLASIYGEGEIVVNSEHRQAAQKVANGFLVSGRALDGVVEAIELGGDWFVMGVQWQPASVTASGLDIQLFRGLIDACSRRAAKPQRTRRAAVA